MSKDRPRPFLFSPLPPVGSLSKYWTMVMRYRTLVHILERSIVVYSWQVCGHGTAFDARDA